VFDALVRKAKLYAEALSDLSSVHRSYDRYTSWLDVKTGVTGREPYISYGIDEISASALKHFREAAENGSRMTPELPELDGAVVRLADTLEELAPVVKRASDYYRQQAYKNDDAKLGQELHAQMPLFERTFAAEAELRSGIDKIKADLDQQQLAEIEKVSGKRYE
jgi:hypothetical protein